MRKLFTSESVTEGHPDKICDQISDAVLDAILEQDPMARVACETCTTTGIVMVMGEVTTTATYRVDDIVRKVVCDIGYDRAKYGFDGNTCAVITALHAQSPDIAQGVDSALEGRFSGDTDIGAGAGMNDAMNYLGEKILVMQMRLASPGSTVGFFIIRFPSMALVAAFL